MTDRFEQAVMIQTKFKEAHEFCKRLDGWKVKVVELCGALEARAILEGREPLAIIIDCIKEAEGDDASILWLMATAYEYYERQT